ncbi:hypothetical protein O6H91_13G030500 [Diphasiastrum complanatum]|uniref:Uncharacterized protein n=1 Tax=Diphasiastrum complanatum TaxID=34168 RepID=A0ACC2BTE9_DIPCM|nr:hypothetical protein O6H91_Y208800 [Diphasiastrum complanatum]KAJ7295170.1 hypothetical protein O6H91_Y208800 [Diphasiastrum complanatum]KAJ7533035.1 hypothetical protein O6H91_13G030500 [Diphasiastrum complanatum]
MVERKPTVSATARKICLCSPTTHPGSYRCRLHRSSTYTPPQAVPKLTTEVSARDVAKKLLQLHKRSRSSVDRFLDQVPFSPKPVDRTSIPRRSRLSNVTFAAEVKQEDDDSDLLACVDKVKDLEADHLYCYRFSKLKL